MSRKRQNSFSVKEPATAAVKNGVIRALSAQQINGKANRVTCNRVIGVVQLTEQVDEEKVINAIKELANSKHVLIGKASDDSHGFTKKKLSFYQRTILLIKTETFSDEQRS